MKQGDREEYYVKTDFAPFNDNPSIKEFLDWLSEVGQFFDLMEIQPSKMVRLATYKLKVEGLFDGIKCSEQDLDKDKT